MNGLRRDDRGRAVYGAEPDGDETIHPRRGVGVYSGIGALERGRAGMGREQWRLTLASCGQGISSKPQPGWYWNYDAGTRYLGTA